MPLSLMITQSGGVDGWATILDTRFTTASKTKVLAQQNGGLSTVGETTIANGLLNSRPPPLRRTASNPSLKRLLGASTLNADSNTWVATQFGWTLIRSLF